VVNGLLSREPNNTNEVMLRKLLFDLGTVDAQIRHPAGRAPTLQPSRAVHQALHATAFSLAQQQSPRTNFKEPRRFYVSSGIATARPCQLPESWLCAIKHTQKNILKK
jgi:hypothetical protein